MRRSALALFAALLLPVPAAGQTLMGRASVTDGDTLEIRGERIRMAAIDAPESRQHCLDGAGQSYACGRRAAMALAERIGVATVRCEATGRDRFGRLVAECFAGSTNLNAWMVESGWAVPLIRFGGRKYESYQDRARAARRGMWQGQFELPEDFRRRARN